MHFPLQFAHTAEQAKEMGFKLMLLPVGVKEMQNQASHWLQVRKERPDYMVMWGWGAMTPTAIKEVIITVAKILFIFPSKFFAI